MPAGEVYAPYGQPYTQGNRNEAGYAGGYYKG